MKSKELELEYEFDMNNNIFVIISFIATVWMFIVTMVYVRWDYFSWGLLIPFILLLLFYVVLDEHNDQVKERNDYRLKEVLDSNNYIQLTHLKAIDYLLRG